VSLQDQKEVTLPDLQKALGPLDSNDVHDQKARVALEARLPVYNGPNPWLPVLPFTWYEWCKIIFFTVTLILPLKLIVLLILLLIMYLTSLPLTIGREYARPGKVTPPLACWRKPFATLERFWMRCLLFVAGFYWIRITYAGKSCGGFRWYAKDLPRTLVPNHCSTFDGFVMYVVTGAVAVAKKEVRNLPVLGRIGGALGGVFLDRENANERQQVREQIKEYQRNTTLPPLVIFPQGTVSNSKTLTVFKTGAFTEEPVQPVALHFTNYFADMLLSPSAGFSLIHALCQFINFLHVEFLEPYYPNEQEKANAVLYADNVRKVIAQKLGAVLTGHGFDDMLLRQFAENYGIDYSRFDSFLVNDVSETYLMKPSTVLTLGKLYVANADQQGVLSLDQFTQLFKLRNQTIAGKIVDVLSGSSSSGGKEQDNIRGIGKDKVIMFEDLLTWATIAWRNSYIDDAIVLFFIYCNL